MTVSVIIEGSTTPAAGVLRSGERATVQLTPRIERLIAKGFVTAVKYLENDPAPAPVAQSIDTDDTDDDVLDAETDGNDAAVPHGNASKAEWLEFLTAMGVDIPVGDDGGLPTRNELRDLWQEVSDVAQ